MSAPTESAAGAGRGRELAWAVTVGVVLADSSVVTLALPEIQRRFDTTVVGVSWVLTAFNLVLALAVLPVAQLLAGRVVSARAAWGGGVVAFAGASLACALASSAGMLVSARCAQAFAGAFVLAGAIELLARSRGSHARGAVVWGGAALIGIAIGPAVGGLLTELISWQAIFAAQVPLVALVIAAAPGAALAPAERGRRGPLRLAPEVALALLSAGSAAALFLLVLLLTEGWGRSPLEAAVIVSVIAVATVASRWLARALGEGTLVIAAGVIVLAGGLAALGLLPEAEPVWTLGPQLLIGLGLGLSLPALTGRALAGADPGGWRGASTIAARHAGIVVGLVLLTPIFSSALPEQQRAAEQSGTGLILEAALPPGRKIELATAIEREIDRADGALPDLRRAFDSVEPGSSGPELARLRARLEDEVDRAATHAFSTVFLLAGGLALLALVPIGWMVWRDEGRGRARAPATPGTATGVASVAGPAAPVASAGPADPATPGWVGRAGAAGRRGVATVAAATLLASAVVAAYLAAGGASYAPHAVADPCDRRPADELRGRGNSALERIALSALDGAACKLRVPREELAVALLSEEARARFAKERGISTDEVDAAVRSGLERAVDDAERTGALSGLEATIVRRVVGVIPVPTLMDALRSSAGQSALETLGKLLR